MDSLIIFVLDKFGNLREFKIEHYEYDGTGTIRLFRHAGGYEKAINESGDMYKKANMDLICLLHDIGGYWIVEVEDEKED